MLAKRLPYGVNRPFRASIRAVSNLGTKKDDPGPSSTSKLPPDVADKGSTPFRHPLAWNKVEFYDKKASSCHDFLTPFFIHLFGPRQGIAQQNLHLVHRFLGHGQ
jgi:hypothetical protein